MKNYIPETKDDIKAVEYLNTLSLEVVRGQIPELLACLQDLNWEISRGVAKFLIPYVNDIKNDIIAILNGIDEPWKWGVLVSVVAKSTNKIDPELLTIIKRIADHPKEREKDDYLDTIARTIIENDNLTSSKNQFPNTAYAKL